MRRPRVWPESQDETPGSKIRYPTTALLAFRVTHIGAGATRLAHAGRLFRRAQQTPFVGRPVVPPLVLRPVLPHRAGARCPGYSGSRRMILLRFGVLLAAIECCII